MHVLKLTNICIYYIEKTEQVNNDQKVTFLVKNTADFDHNCDSQGISRHL